VEADSDTIKLSWINSTECDSCTVSYTIEWKNITDGSKSGIGYTECTYYDIENLEACVTFEVSVSVVYEDGSSSDITSINVTTLTDGKWHVMCRFMACIYILYSNSYS
jgi:hypothetical protein